MAYNTANPPNKVNLGALTDFGSSSGTGGSIWAYQSADTIATVKAAGYFADGVARGMQPGDTVLVYDTTTPALSVAFVKQVNANGLAVDINQTPLTAT